MSAHCNQCGTDLVYPEGTWPLGECPVCVVTAELALARDVIESARLAPAMLAECTAISPKRETFHSALEWFAHRDELVAELRAAFARYDAGTTA